MRKSVRPGAVLLNGSLVLIGAALALLAMELLLRAAPNLAPAEVRVNPPVRRIEPHVDEVYDVRLSDGDLFHWLEGRIAPLNPEQDPVVARVLLEIDSNGFRNSAPVKNSYEVVVIGDSFTIAKNVAFPWPARLADYLGLDVLNLAQSAFGPQEELNVLERYGLQKQPTWIVMAFFEGNDLHDAGAYERANPFIVTRLGKYILTRAVEKWEVGQTSEVDRDDVRQLKDTAYLYPILVELRANDVQMAFFPPYVSWLSASLETIEPSENFRLVAESILSVQQLSKEINAEFLLVYIPSKPHVYLEYVSEAEILRSVFEDVKEVSLDGSGLLGFSADSVLPKDVYLRSDDQEQLLKNFAAEENIEFLDLTPIFKAEAAKGVELYYPYDTHWNQTGHDLAAQAIAERMRSTEAPTSEN